MLMALDPSSSLAQRFASARRGVNAWRLRSRAVGSSYQGLVKALIKVSPRLLRAIGDHLRDQMPRLAGKHWKRGGWVLMGVDGSKFNLPRTQALLDSFGSAGKNHSGPQAYLTTLLHLSTGLPWDARIGRAAASERGHLKRMLKRLPPGALLLADAGFVGYPLWSLLQQRRQHFLIRVGSNVKLLKYLGYGFCQRAGLVYLWPDQERRAGRPPLVLRLIRLQDGRKQMCLISNVLEQAQLSDAQAADAYHLRWGIEWWYRQLKQTAGRRQLASRAPRQATLELAWLVVAMTLLGLMGVQDAIQRGRDPLTLSPAGTLRVLRTLALRPQLRGGLRTLRRMLGACVKDTFKREAPKTRVPWATKKREHPPGLPHITEPTPTQVAAAAQLRGINAAW
jgi:hypothetical protein